MNFIYINKKSGIKMLKAVVALPLAFVILATILIYCVISSYLPLITSAFNLVSTNTSLSFNKTLESIFDFLDPDDVADNENNIEGENSQKDAEVPETTVDISEITMPKYQQHYANISIQELQINCKLYYGDSDAVLKNGAGQYTGSRLPGFGHPILIAAHNTSYFRALEWVEIGNKVQIQTGYGTYIYEVYKKQVAKWDDKSVYDLTLEEEILILYTCYPFGSLGFKSDRLFVFAKKISGPVVIW